MTTVCPLCPQDACCHFTPKSPDPFIRRDADMELAKFGHLNHIIDMICCISDSISATLTGTATLDFGDTATQTSTDLTISVPGALVGSPVALGLPSDPDADSNFTAWVSSAGVVTVRFNNYSGDSIDPGSASYTVKVFN